MVQLTKPHDITLYKEIHWYCHSVSLGGNVAIMQICLNCR